MRYFLFFAILASGNVLAADVCKVGIQNVTKPYTQDVPNSGGLAVKVVPGTVTVALSCTNEKDSAKVEDAYEKDIYEISPLLHARVIKIAMEKGYKAIDGQTFVKE